MNDLNKPRITVTVVKGADTEGYDIIKVIGDLDKAGLDYVRDQLDKAVEECTTAYLVINFDELNFINSESIGYLLTVYYRLQKNSKKLVVIGAQEKILDVLDVIGLLKIIDNYPTMHAFKEAIEQK